MKFRNGGEALFVGPCPSRWAATAGREKEAGGGGRVAPLCCRGSSSRAGKKGNQGAGKLHGFDCPAEVRSYPQSRTKRKMLRSWVFELFLSEKKRGAGVGGDDDPVGRTADQKKRPTKGDKKGNGGGGLRIIPSRGIRQC